MVNKHMESQEYMKQAIASFLDQFQPKTEADIAALRSIQTALAAGQSLESQYHNFISIGDVDLLRAFYETVPDVEEQILAHPNCPDGLISEPSQPVILTTPTEDAAPTPKGKHPLLVLDQEIDLDLKGLVAYEAALPAGEITGQERSGCIRRIENLQRLFDRVPKVLHETDLTDNENPLFYDLLLAKQRISSNLKAFTRLRIGLFNRFAKSEHEQEEDPERSLWDETPKEVEPEQGSEGGSKPEGPTEEALEEKALAAFLAEEEARAAMEAKAAEKKASNVKRQQRLRQQAKDQEERSLQEQRQREESARNADRHEYDNQQLQHDPGSDYKPAGGGYAVPPYEYSVPSGPSAAPNHAYDDQAEVLRRQETARKDSVMEESARQREEHRAFQAENVQKYQEQVDRSYQYESFGKSHIDFSGKENRGTPDVYPNAPENQIPTPGPQSKEASASPYPSATQPHPADQPFYPDKPTQHQQTEQHADPIQPETRKIDPSHVEPAAPSDQPFYPGTTPEHRQPEQYTDPLQSETRKIDYSHVEPAAPSDQPFYPGSTPEYRQPEQRADPLQSETRKIDPSHVEPAAPSSQSFYPGTTPEYRQPEQYADPLQSETRKIDHSHADQAAPVQAPFYAPKQDPAVDRSSYDVLTREREAREQTAHDHPAGTVKDHQDKMARSYGYQSSGHVQIDSSGKENHSSEPFQPYGYTPGGGVAPVYAASQVRSAVKMNNPEIYQMAADSGKITPELSRTMRDNLIEMRKEYESAKGTPAFQDVSRRYNDARAAVMSLTNDIRNNQITLEQISSPATNTANVSRAFHPGRSDSFTAFQYTPTGVQGTSYEKGQATGGVVVHNTPGAAGKEVYSRENPMLVTKAYEESLSRDAKLAKAQLRERTDLQHHSNPAAKLTAAELAAYRTSLDAYEGFRRAKAEGLVKVSSATGAINTPDQSAWAARQETYRQTVEKNQWRQNRANEGRPTPGPIPHDNSSGSRHSNDHQDWNRSETNSGDRKGNRDRDRNDRRDDRGRNNNDRRDRTTNNNDRWDGRDRKNNNEHRDGRDRNNNNDHWDDRKRNNNNDHRNGNNNGGGEGRTPRPDPNRTDNWRDRTPHLKVAPFGSVFSINYNRGKYTTGEKGASAKLLNRETKLQRTSAMRNMGAQLYRNYSTYVPEASTMAGRKLYTMLQASNEAGSQTIRTFEQGRYYGFAGAGIVIAQATRNVGNIKRFERQAAKSELHQYGFKRELTNKEVARKFHTQVNEGRAVKKEIRQMYERESGLSVPERRLLSEKIKAHKGMGKETAKWAALHNARIKEKVQREVLEELHRNRNGYGLVTDHALKDLQAQRRQIQIQRRDILKNPLERAALNKRISELQKKGKDNLSEAEFGELRELRGKLGKLSSDPRLKTLDRQEQEILKLYTKKPDQTSVGFKHIRLKDAQELRDKVLRDHAVLESDKFAQFKGIKTSVIKSNKQLMERQSEVAKLKVKNLLGKSKRTASEEQELRNLIKLLNGNQEQIKAHATILNLRNVRDMKIEAIDKVRKTLLKNKQRKRIGKMALVSFIMRPLQEGDNIGAQGLAKGISIGTNPYVRGLVRSSVNSTIRFTKFAATKIGKVTGLDKTLAPAINKTKELYAGARKIVHTPKELQKKAIKTATEVTKQTASRLTPQFIKTGNTAIRSKMANLAARLQKSNLGKAYEAIARSFSKMKAAIGTAAKVIGAVVGKVVLVLLALILVAGLITVIGGAIAGSVPSFLIMGDDVNEQTSKIDLTSYAQVYNEELMAFQEEIIAAKTAKDYENVTEICYGPTDYDNIKEVLSMMAVRMSQDLDMEENPEVGPYIRSLFNDSHIIETEESEPYSCSGCKTRTVETGHNASCPVDCDTTHTTTETYCPGDHVDLTIIITTLVFDDIFYADSKGNADAEVEQGGLIGKFEISYYCPCEKCCGEGSNGTTSTGTKATANRTIAVDPSVIQLGTKVMIDGKEYVAEDRGGAITGNRIDIFVDSHEEALALGRRNNVPVYSVEYVGEGMQSSGEWNGWVEENIIWAKTIYGTDWGELYEGVDAMGAYTGTWNDNYDWDSFEYSDETNLTQAQQRVAYIAQNSASFGIAANAGYCQQWVRLVYSAAGYTGGNAASANSAGDQWLVSSDWSNIPVGAAVYGYSSSVYGHVGIYVGNGKVYHNIGGVDVDSLEEWVSKYKGYGWGWQGGHDLTAATSGS